MTAGCGGDANERPGANAGRPSYDAEGYATGPHPVPSTLPNLVLVLVDTLRADALQTDGDGPDPMPYLASLARRGVSFPEAAAASSWTVPSLVSLLTGLRPSRHRADDPRSSALALPESITTYAEVLARTYGYETVAFSGGPWFRLGTGLFQGFETCEGNFGLQGTEDVVGGWARRRNPARPFFLLLHTFEVHEPYGAANHPWPPTRAMPQADPALRAVRDAESYVRAFFLDGARRDALEATHGDAYRNAVIDVMDGVEPAFDRALAEDLRRAYWDGVRWFDGVLARAVRSLTGWGLLEDAVLVVASDHGEAFGEHGILGHGRQLYEELIRVPLVMVGPPPFDGGREIPGSMGLVDVMPTFFDWAGLVDVARIDGRSVLERVRGRPGGHPVISEVRRTMHVTGRHKSGFCVSVRSERWKYVLTWDDRRGRITEEVYDLAADPEERHDLARATRRIPAALPLDEAFCRAIRDVRAPLRARAEAVASTGILSTPYGAGLARPEALPPAPCDLPE